MAEKLTVEGLELRAGRRQAGLFSASVGRISWRGWLLGREELGKRCPGACAPGYTMSPLRGWDTYPGWRQQQCATAIGLKKKAATALTLSPRQLGGFVCFLARSDFGPQSLPRVEKRLRTLGDRHLLGRSCYPGLRCLALSGQWNSVLLAEWRC